MYSFYLKYNRTFNVSVVSPPVRESLEDNSGFQALDSGFRNIEFRISSLEISDSEEFLFLDFKIFAGFWISGIQIGSQGADSGFQSCVFTGFRILLIHGASRSFTVSFKSVIKGKDVLIFEIFHLNRICFEFLVSIKTRQLGPRRPQ